MFTSNREGAIPREPRGATREQQGTLRGDWESLVDATAAAIRALSDPCESQLIEQTYLNQRRGEEGKSERKIEKEKGDNTGRNVSVEH